MAIFAILMSATALRADPPTPPAIPTYDELKQMYADKQYQPLLQKLSAILQLHGQAAANYDAYQLYTLRAETHVQLKRADSAITAFNDAARVADEKKKLTDLASARVMAEIVKKSPGMVYKHVNSPEKAHPETFDLTDIDPDKRKAAFAAIFDDEMTAATPKVKNAMSNAQSVGPVLAFAKSSGPLRLLELAATGETKKCDEVLGGLAKHAQEVIAKTTQQMDTRTDAIKSEAQKVVQSMQPSAVRNQPATVVYRRAGLTTAQMNELKNIVQTCTGVPEGDKMLSDALGDPDGKFASLGEEAGKIKQKAAGVLDTDYTATASSPSGLQ
jgi:hypothetical protein